MEDNAMMITKVKNIYIMLLHAISKENIAMVDHFLDDELTKKYKEIINKNISNNIRQVYRQLNITNLKIINEDNEFVTFQGLTRYISYFVDRKNNKYVSGDNVNRISKTVILKFRKNDSKSKKLYNCPNCGAGMKINTTGICSYCGTTLDDKYTPYVLCSIN